MKKILCALMVAGTSSLATNMEVSLRSSLKFDAESGMQKPMQKVINLLQDMQKQMEKDANDDQDLSDKMGCECLTQDKEKTDSIAKATSLTSDLTSKIEELKASGSGLETEIKGLKNEVAADTTALAEATGIREKQLAEFTKEERETVISTKNLAGAIMALKKTNSLMQVPHSAAVSVAGVVKQILQTHASMIADLLSPQERQAVTAFVQNPDAYRAAANAAKQHTFSALQESSGEASEMQDSSGEESDAQADALGPSGEIFGILKQMKETFETNLASSQEKEKSNQKDFEDLKIAKMGEIAAGQKQLDTKQTQLADDNDTLSQAKVNNKDTQRSLDADTKFLADLKEKCAIQDKEFADRKKSRAEELEAVSKALEVLTDDEARALMSKTLKFVQTGSTKHSARRTQAANLLTSLSQQTDNPRLAFLALSLRGDTFAKVKKAIDEMVVDLKEANLEEVKQKDFCVKELNSNALQAQRKTAKIADLDTSIAGLQATVKELVDAIKTLRDEIKQTEVELKKAGEEREKQNKEFQKTIADQRATQKLLQKAIAVLKGAFAKQAAAAAAFIQEHNGRGAEKFAYAEGGGPDKVMDLLENIVNDAKAVEKKAVRDEENMAYEYTKVVDASNAAIKQKNKAIVNKSGTKAKKKVELATAISDLNDAKLEMERLTNQKMELDQQCTKLLSNFDATQGKRSTEIAALHQAKAIMSGAK